MNKKIPIIIVLVLFIISVGCTIAGFIKSNENHELKNDNININNNQNNNEENDVTDNKENESEAEDNNVIDNEEDDSEDEGDFIDINHLLPEIKENLKNKKLDFSNILKKYNNDNLELQVYKANEKIDNLIPFESIKEGEKYEEPDYISGTLSLENGVPYITLDGKKKGSKFTNVKEIFFINSGEYIHEFAFLCNNGTLYLGDDLFELYEYDSDNDGSPDIIYKFVDINNFDKAKKANTSNKFIEIRKLDIGWISDDTEAIGLIGITEKGTYELFLIVS